MGLRLSIYLVSFDISLNQHGVRLNACVALSFHLLCVCRIKCNYVYPNFGSCIEQSGAMLLYHQDKTGGLCVAFLGEIVLLNVRMNYPITTIGPQVHRDVNHVALVVDVLGVGPGWTQSKLNQAPFEAPGTWFRTECNDNCTGTHMQLQSVYAHLKLSSLIVHLASFAI